MTLTSKMLPIRLVGRRYASLRLAETLSCEKYTVTKSTSQQSRRITTHIRSSLLGSSHYDIHDPIDYARGWAWQQYLLSRRLAQRRNQQLSNNNNNNDNDLILVLEHAPVYTLGRGADETHLTFLKEQLHDALRQRLSRSNRGPTSARLSVDRRKLEENILCLEEGQAIDVLSTLATPVLAPNGAPIYRVERGGEVTFHGPGQLVIYPMLDLRRPPYREDLHWFLRMVEQIVIDTLDEYNIDGKRDDANTGVWVDGSKVAAVGVSASSWITTHGFALNVEPDLTYFDPSIIVPCGIEERGVTSIAEILYKRGEKVPSIVQVSQVVMNKIENVFDIENEYGEAIR